MNLQADSANIARCLWGLKCLPCLFIQQERLRCAASITLAQRPSLLTQQVGRFRFLAILVLLTTNLLHQDTYFYVSKTHSHLAHKQTHTQRYTHTNNVDQCLEVLKCIPCLLIQQVHLRCMATSTLAQRPCLFIQQVGSCSCQATITHTHTHTYSPTYTSTYTHALRGQRQTNTENTKYIC